MSAPSKQAVKAAHRVFAYLKCTANACVKYAANGASDRKADEHLYAYTNLSDADCKISARSTGGYVIFFNGCPISWSSALQKIVALSSCESEYIQAALAAKEVLYLRSILQRMGLAQRRTIMYIDNMAALNLTENPVNRG